MIESIESLLDVAEAAIVIPPLQAVSDFVFKFLHEDVKAHLHACVAGNLQAPPAIPVRSFRTVHKYATLPSHERLPPVVPACGSDSESAWDKSDPDDSGAGISVMITMIRTLTMMHQVLLYQFTCLHLQGLWRPRFLYSH